MKAKHLWITHKSKEKSRGKLENIFKLNKNETQPTRIFMMLLIQYLEEFIALNKKKSQLRAFTFPLGNIKKEEHVKPKHSEDRKL